MEGGAESLAGAEDEKRSRGQTGPLFTLCFVI